MAASQTFPLVTDAAREELAVRGEAIYDALKAQWGPEQDGQYVVIHVDTGDYEIGPTFSRTNRTMLAQHGADGRLFARKIGAEPDSDGLAARLLLSELREGRQK